MNQTVLNNKHMCVRGRVHVCIYVFVTTYVRVYAYVHAVSVTLVYEFWCFISVNVLNLFGQSYCLLLTILSVFR